MRKVTCIWSVIEAKEGCNAPISNAVAVAKGKNGEKGNRFSGSVGQPPAQALLGAVCSSES